MLKVATAEEMRSIDRKTIEKYGLAGTVLMERAGLAVTARINEVYADRKVIVLCGGGNNGGDGLVIARLLCNQGSDVEVFLSSRPDALRGDAKTNYHAAMTFGVRIRPLSRFLRYAPSLHGSYPLIVDALLGTGLNKEVKGLLSEVIAVLSSLSCPVVSVDIPSGVCSDTGRVMGRAVRADQTVTFGLLKRGHVFYPGAACAGQLCVADIGFPRSLLESDRIRVHFVERKDVLSLFPERQKQSHKGTYGHVLIVAGSRGKTGAALMAARACLKSGAGLVTIGIPDTLVQAFQSRVTEEMILPLPDKGKGTLSMKAADDILDFIQKRGNVLAAGPGLSVDREISDLLEFLITESAVPMVIDADGLNAIADRTGILKKSRAPLVLTPHPGEMARLLRRSSSLTAVSPDAIEKDRAGSALAFAKKTKTVLVLKGVPTVTATPGGKVFVNSTGNSGMATAGTGDVLTGMISAFLAQGIVPEDAAIAGAYMHGYIGDLVAREKGQYSMIASDIIRKIPRAFASLKTD